MRSASRYLFVLVSTAGCGAPVPLALPTSYEVGPCTVDARSDSRGLEPEGWALPEGFRFDSGVLSSGTPAVADDWPAPEWSPHAVLAGDDCPEWISNTRLPVVLSHVSGWRATGQFDGWYGSGGAVVAARIWALFDEEAALVPAEALEVEASDLAGGYSVTAGTGILSGDVELIWAAP